MKPVEINDLLQYRFLSALRYAPDGERAAFVVSNADEEGTGYESRLWLYEKGALRQLSALGKENRFVWLDSERLLFPAARTEKEKKHSEAGEDFSSWYVLDLRGGEALPFFTLPLRVSAMRVLGEGRFALTATVERARPALYAADEEAREQAQKEREEERDYEVLEELPFCSNGKGIVSGQREALFFFTPEPRELRMLTEMPEECLGMAQLGGELFFAVSRRETKLSPLGFTLRALDIRTGVTRTVGEYPQLSFSAMEAVGGELWLLGSECKRYGLNENAWAWRVDAQSGALSVLRREEHSLYNSVCSDCRLGGGREAAALEDGLLHLTTRGGTACLRLLTAEGEDRPLLEEPGCIDCFDAAGDEVLLVGLYDMRPQELYRFDRRSGALERLSDFNGPALEGRYIARPQPLSVQSGGAKIEGWVLPPINYDPSQRYGAVLDVHGGPKVAYGPVFFHEMQLWASRGYFVLFCNPTGSDGGDNDFMDIRGKYGTVDFENLMDFTDAVLASWPQIDPERLCLTGGSYGGYMTNWIIGHTDRFCCAASQRSISNWLSFWGTSDIGCLFTADQNAADLYESPEALWERSPLKYADKVKTPTLFIHADEDYRCPLEQGLQMYTALVDRGVEARLCLFHGENHELSRSGKPKHRLRRLEEITAWFEKHTKG